MIVVVSGPSGSGKTTIVTRVCDAINYTRSISYTTRAPRADEHHGIDYNFVSSRVFDDMQDSGHFLEHATVSGNKYGTPHPSDHNTILTIDPQGMKQVRKLHNHILTIFIMPPSKEELERRLVARGKDSIKTIVKRMREFDNFKMASQSYDYVILNDSLEVAVKRVVGIITSTPI